MQLIQPPQFEETSLCPYLPGRSKRYEYFLAGSLTAEECAGFLGAGWRKFGLYYFRPACPGCSDCTPLRVPTAEFAPSRSQRRLLRRNADLRVEFGPLRFSERVYTIYSEHSRCRFSHETDPEEFILHFLLPSCPALQSEIYCGDELIGAGFLDVGEDCLSSVYFCFDPRFDHRRLGIFAVLQEIDHARRLGLSHYHLGYYVPGCPVMGYKDHFRPREYFDWGSRRWRRIEGSPECERPRGSGDFDLT